MSDVSRYPLFGGFAVVALLAGGGEVGLALVFVLVPVLKVRRVRMFVSLGRVLRGGECQPLGGISPCA